MSATHTGLGDVRGRLKGASPSGLPRGGPHSLTPGARCSMFWETHLCLCRPLSDSRVKLHPPSPPARTLVTIPVQSLEVCRSPRCVSWPNTAATSQPGACHELQCEPRLSARSRPVSRAQPLLSRCRFRPTAACSCGDVCVFLSEQPPPPTPETSRAQFQETAGRTEEVEAGAQPVTSGRKNWTKDRGGLQKSPRKPCSDVPLSCYS